MGEEHVYICGGLFNHKKLSCHLKESRYNNRSRSLLSEISWTVKDKNFVEGVNMIKVLCIDV